MQSWMSNPLLDIQSVNYFEYAAEYRSHSSKLKTNVFECRADCRTRSSISKVLWFWMQSLMLNSQPDIQSVYGVEWRAERRSHSSIFKLCIILNAELNVDLTARYSRCMFSNAELNVEPIARYSRCVWFWMQTWISIPQLEIQDECFRMQSWLSNP